MPDTGMTIGLIKALGGGASEAEVEELRSAIAQIQEDIPGAVADWLDDHPEATTTVQDGSITDAKLAPSVLSEFADAEDVIRLANSVNADVPYVRTGSATSGATAWAQTDTIKGIKLKKGQQYTISVSNESAAASAITVTLADSNNTTLKQVQLAANGTSASDTYTPSNDYDNAIIYFKTGIKTGVTLTISIAATDLAIPAIDVLKTNDLMGLIVIPLRNATGSNKQTYRAFHFKIKSGTKIYCYTKNGNSFNLLATYADGTTGTLISGVSSEQSITTNKDIEYLGYFLLPNYDDELYMYGDLYKSQLAADQHLSNISEVKIGDFSVTGYVASDGYLNGASNAHRTDYMDVEQFDHVFVNTSISSGGCAIAFFNSSKEFMQSASYTGAKYNFTCAIPEGAKYVIFSEYEYPTASGYLYVDGSVSRGQIVDSENIKTLQTWKKQIFDADAIGTFEKFGVCGDSLSVGYMADSGGTAHGRNLWYSWGQVLARRYGNVCLNFGASGLDTATWFTNDTYGNVQVAQSNNKCQAYIIGLGVNDSVSSENVGSTSDINLSDYTQNGDSFYGRYAKVIQAIQAVAPTAYIFALTIPKTNGDTSFRYSALKNNAIKGVVEYLDSDNVYAIDADDYMAWWADDKITHEEYSTHYTSMGYQHIASLIARMVSDCMNENYSNFRDIAFVPYGSNNVIE